MGPPGAGKGTQARRIAEEYGLPHIATGDLLREAARGESELGRCAGEYLDRGELVPDELMIEMVDRRLDEPDALRGYLLDGFPRTAAQAEALLMLLPRRGQRLDAVLHLDVPDAALADRLVGRRTCPECARVYHVVTSPPRVAGRCDLDQATLVQREDDVLETIGRRLDVYHAETEPMLALFRERGLLRSIVGDGGIERTFARIVEALKGTGRE